MLHLDNRSLRSYTTGLASPSSSLLRGNSKLSGCPGSYDQQPYPSRCRAIHNRWLRGRYVGSPVFTTMKSRIESPPSHIRPVADGYVSQARIGRLGDFPRTSNTVEGEDQRPPPGTSIGQTYGSGTSSGWTGGIWGTSALGGGFAKSSNETPRSTGTSSIRGTEPEYGQI